MKERKEGKKGKKERKGRKEGRVRKKEGKLLTDQLNLELEMSD